MSNEIVLMRLRVELYIAAQRFKGEDLKSFRTLISEIKDVLDVDEIIEKQGPKVNGY